MQQNLQMLCGKMTYVSHLSPKIYPSSFPTLPSAPEMYLDKCHHGAPLPPGFIIMQTEGEGMRLGYYTPSSLQATTHQFPSGFPQLLLPSPL